MTARELDIIWQALMTGQSLIEDQIALEQAGLESGFDKGVLRNYRRESDKALAIVNSLLDNSNNK